MGPSDAELARRAASGDLASFEQLIIRYERSVRSIARAFLADSHACDDVTQEAFVAAFRGLGALREPECFGPWLMQIARRTATRVKEKEGRQPIPGLLEEPIGRELETPPHDLLMLIERLPEQERLVISMRYFDGHSSQEIADATGIPIGTVTKQLSRAYDRLRQWLAPSKENVHHE